MINSEVDFFLFTLIVYLKLLKSQMSEGVILCNTMFISILMYTHINVYIFFYFFFAIDLFALCAVAAAAAASTYIYEYIYFIIIQSKFSNAH